MPGAILPSIFSRLVYVLEHKVMVFSCNIQTRDMSASNTVIEMRVLHGCAVATSVSLALGNFSAHSSACKIFSSLFFFSFFFSENGFCDLYRVIWNRKFPPDSSRSDLLL